MASSAVQGALNGAFWTTCSCCSTPITSQKEALGPTFSEKGANTARHLSIRISARLSHPPTEFPQNCRVLSLDPVLTTSVGTRTLVGRKKGNWRPIQAAIATERIEAGQTSRSEEFVAVVEGGSELSRKVKKEIEAKSNKVKQLQQEIDALYDATFADVVFDSDGEKPREEWNVGFPGLLRNLFQKPKENERPEGVLGEVCEKSWRELGRSDPGKLKALMASVDRQKWQLFQRQIHPLQLTRDRLAKELKRLEVHLEEALSASTIVPEVDLGGEEEEIVRNLVEGREARIVLISGFESFNVALYKQAATQVRKRFPGIRVDVFSDRDIGAKRQEIEAALAKADVFFGSLLFDYDQCEWLKEKVSEIPVRLCFESSLELMSTTQIGSFTMGGGQKRGMPAPVKAVLSKFGGGKEEDRMVGYLSFLKIGPKLLRFLPGKKVRDLRNWLTIYGYWNQGGIENVVSMLLYITDEYLVKTGLAPVSVKETPALGLYHPDYDGYFESTSAYLAWHRRAKAMPPGTPTVAVLLYRKHVITNQKYIPRLIRSFEKDGLRPLPIFINGVEAHTVVRDLLTTTFEQERRRKRIVDIPSLKKDAATVDAVVSTVGFPLVGGPAGTMEGGRQAEVAKQILSAKNVPYVVSAPLLIQDIPSWLRDGIQGLQSVVLYSLPELDGAIDAVPLGGLVGDGIHLVPERVRRLTSRLKKWISLRAKPASERKVAIVLYGFPPGVGATGTAALLNVPRSLEALLSRLRQEGYDLGACPDEIDGEQLIRVLSELDDERVILKGEKGGEEALAYARSRVEGEGEKLQNVTTHVKTVDYRTLKKWIGETLTGRMERTWGELHRYRGIRTDANGASVVSGLRLGNVFIGVQPLLGIEGDPMRLLFERDLTPHPQYAAFYKWLQNDMNADAVIHFGMHGTVEWLPGSPLGNTGSSWSDVLMGNLPNVYVYAANNPSESIVAKRRGYGTIVSYNVPPYGRAGLYKELASLRELLQEYREDPVANRTLRASIVGVLQTSGLDSDCPFREATQETEATVLREDDVSTVDDAEFDAYVARLYEYLSVVENRLFSEGLHTLGEPPTVDQMQQYLSAYLGDDLPEQAVEAIARTPGGLAEVRQRLEELYREENVPASKDEYQAKVTEALAVRDLLMQNTEEMDSLVKALNGEYILPAVGGDLLRDGPGVLPTGRNIHALDPYRMPSAAAWERGSAIARNIVKQHQQEHGNAYPETVAVMLWGLDAIKTRGESLAIALALVGAVPVKEGTGRIVRFELVPLSELGRPRIDVLANLSGIFRDSFANVVELLDDLFKRAAEADEPPEMNYIRKHALDLESQGVENTSARIFSNPAGDYGSIVNERVGTSDWNDGAELGDTWQSRNSFSYGRGEQGVARPEVLRTLLKSTDRIVQEIDSVEYGLTDIQEYYANTGAMKAAAETMRDGKKTQCSIVESFGKDLTARDLDQTLRLEYRAKLLNPKWAQKMAAQGSGGAFEISQRMTALVGWGGTADFKEDWVYDQAAETYALDAEMAAKLRKANPQAFQNVVRRMLEAAGRGLWNADPETIEKLREIYSEMEDELEGVAIK